MFSEEEQKVHNPPSSLVPRLHAVHVKKLQTINPLVTSAPSQRELILIVIYNSMYYNILSSVHMFALQLCAARIWPVQG